MATSAGERLTRAISERIKTQETISNGILTFTVITAWYIEIPVIASRKSVVTISLLI